MDSVEKSYVLMDVILDNADEFRSSSNYKTNVVLELYVNLIAEKNLDLVFT